MSIFSKGKTKSSLVNYKNSNVKDEDYKKESAEDELKRMEEYRKLVETNKQIRRQLTNELHKEIKKNEKQYGYNYCVVCGKEIKSFISPCDLCVNQHCNVCVNYCLVDSYECLHKLSSNKVNVTCMDGFCRKCGKPVSINFNAISYLHKECRNSGGRYCIIDEALPSKKTTVKKLTGLNYLKDKIHSNITMTDEQIKEREILIEKERIRKENIKQKNQIIFKKQTGTCNILKDHVEQLKDDPERLSTDFIKEIMGIKKCKKVSD